VYEHHRPARSASPGQPSHADIITRAGAERAFGSLIRMADQNPVVKINAIEVPPEAGPELEKRFAHRAHAVDNQPGFLGFQLLRPVKGEDRYFVVTQWESEEAFQAWASGPAIEAHKGQQTNPVATGASLLEFEVVLDVAGAKS
jgi:heme oxygenase (mycobilin-producing)